MKDTYRILAINPGSTSTKFGVFENETPLFERVVRHAVGEFENCPNLLAQKEYCTNLILEALALHHIRPADLDAVCGLAGLFFKASPRRDICSPAEAK